jgi:ABC-type branched-subunit amino acid transport system ATPase component
VLNLISGFYRMDAGSLAIDGHRVDQRRRHAMVGHGVARTFQTPMLVDELTVVENVAHAAETVTAGTSLGSFLRTPGGRRLRHESVATAHDCLGLVGLSAFAGERCGDLPHGLRRLVEVARALALKPKFALLDEPAAGLSMAEIDHLRTTLKVLNEANVGVLLVEHNIPLVLDVCERVTVLHLGQVIAEGPPVRVIEDEQVAMAFLGKAGV